jgi:hypothetical protein
MSPEALQTGIGFMIPDPPRQLGGLLIAENYTSDMVVLPAHRQGKITLVDKDTGTYEEVSLARMTQLAREARDDKRPVWVVIGKPIPKAKKNNSDHPGTGLPG